MANLFTPEQLAYLDKHYAKIPHNHTWEQVRDADGQTVAQAFENVDEAIADLIEDEGDGPIDLDEEDTEG